MILVICIVSTIATTAISLSLPDWYCTTAAIVPVATARENNVHVGGGLGTQAILSEAMDATITADICVEILQSRSVADRIIERFYLMNVYDSKFLPEARKELREHSSIDVSEKGVVIISVEDRDAKRSAEMARAYVEELDRISKSLITSRATSKRLFLGGRLTELERELGRIEDLQSKEARNREVLYRLLAREYELAKMEEAKSTPMINIIDQPGIPEETCKPKRWQMVTLTGICSLVASVFVALVRSIICSL